MEPLTLIGLAATYAGAAVARRCAEKPVDEAWDYFRSNWWPPLWQRATTVGRFESHDDSREDMASKNADENAEALEQARRIFASTPALRRAELVAPVLRYAQILWVDDNPENNIYEREVLQTLGSNTDVATSTEQGIVALQSKVYDLVVSDMARGNAPDEGLVLLREMRKRRYPQQVVFYVGTVDPQKGKPAESFGITDRPDELLHLIMDILERHRV